ncbi:hypothetical protein KXW36_000711, partial [Aspergillus fumigatus]
YGINCQNFQVLPGGFSRRRVSHLQRYVRDHCLDNTRRSCSSGPAELPGGQLVPLGFGLRFQMFGLL